MPNHDSCKKRMKQDAKRSERNSAVKKTIKTFVKKINSDIDIKEKEELVKTIYSKLDKAAKTGVIHKRTASRKKSRIMTAVNKEKAQQVDS